MSEISLGFKHYLLILVWCLTSDLESCGLKHVTDQPGLSEQDVTRALFLARRLRRRLPRSPDTVESDEIWLEILRVVCALRAVLDVYGKSSFDAVVAEARRTTSDIARADIRRSFEQKCAAGQIDFRLHGLSKVLAGNAENVRMDHAIQESFLLKRPDRYRIFLAFDDRNLKPEEQAIIGDAKKLARWIVEDGRKDGRIDGLLAMALVLMKTTSVRLNPKIPKVITARFDRMSRKAAMALGALVYRDQYEQLKLSWNLG